MAITASTLSVDNIVRGGPGKSLFEDGKTVAGSSTWNQGDLVCFDTSSHSVRVVAATGDAVTIVGVADNNVISGKLVGPYTGLTQVDAAQSSPGFVGPKYGVTARLKLHTGDAFVLGCKVYLSDGDDTQTVTSTAPDANYIGIFVGSGGSAVASAAADQLGDILIGARYPSATGTGLNFG
jgi:hypothetical protein